MKNLLKGAAAVVVVMIVSMLIHVFFNMKGIELPTNNVTEVLLTSSFATLIYHVLTKNEKDKDNQE